MTYDLNFPALPLPGTCPGSQPIRCPKNSLYPTSPPSTTPTTVPSRRRSGWVKIGQPFGILHGGGPSKPNKINNIIHAFKDLNLTVSEEQTIQGYIARAKIADRIFSSVGHFDIIPDENI